MSYYQDDGSVANKAITIAAQQAGKPYIWGAAGPDTFDCSGLVHYAFAGAGLPGTGRQTSHLWTTATIRFMGDGISQGAEQPGDLVMTHPGHVGICIGNGKMWNAPQTGIPVRIDSYSKVFAIRRIATPASSAVVTATNNASPVDFVSGIKDALSGVDSLVSWFTDPHSWVRMGEVFGGVVCLLFAIRM